KVLYRSKVRVEHRASLGEHQNIREIHVALLRLNSALHVGESDNVSILTDPQLIELEGRPHVFHEKRYANQRQAWYLALALLLARYDLLRLEEGDLGDGEPILILDDVFSELDVHRRERLGRIVTDASQVLITTANDTDIPASLDGEIHVVDVTLGEAVPRSGGGLR